ncbi:MAG TPA: hypothetical protein VF026_11790 [Ktedonobacteraceae bacterium]
MYYRVAIQGEAGPTWQWKSTVLSDLSSLLRFLRLYSALPQDHLLVCSSCSRKGLQEQIEQENQGLASQAVTAAHFLHERRIQLPAEARRPAARQEGTSPGRVATAMLCQEPVRVSGGGGSALESTSVSTLQRRREELENGSGGDHDVPYRLSLPFALPPVLAWMTLLARVHRGELQP